MTKEKATTEDKILKDAQYRKGLSIAFFNATNAAISLCAGMDVHEEKTLNKIIELRDFFLEEHKNYYAKVIANVGLNYKAEDSIKKLESTKSLEELKMAWLLLSADERANEQIRKVAGDLKKKYNEKA